MGKGGSSFHRGRSTIRHVEKSGAGPRYSSSRLATFIIPVINLTNAYTGWKAEYRASHPTYLDWPEEDAVVLDMAGIYIR
jgi:hypothetical protein